MRGLFFFIFYNECTDQKDAASPETSSLTNVNYHNVVKPQMHVWSPPGSEWSLCKGNNMQVHAICHTLVLRIYNLNFRVLILLPKD